MKTENQSTSIEQLFRNTVQRDPNVRNAYLRVYSDKTGLNLNLAEGRTGDVPANPAQPNYMASVGKIFTSTIVSILHEQGKLSFDERIVDYLDRALTATFLSSRAGITLETFRSGTC